MRKVNNKGFTLLEVIIAIAILSVVVFIGYNVINGSNKVTIKQKNITDSQTAINLVNKYLSKDIENIDIDKIDKDLNYKKSKIDNGKYEYIYQISVNNLKEDNKNIDQVEYKINTTFDKQDTKTKGTYDIIRVSKSKEAIVNSINLANNLQIIYTSDSNIDDINPFTIEKIGEFYTVSMDYLDKNNEKYKFSVTPRASKIKGNTIVGGDEEEGGGEIIIPIPPEKMPDEVVEEFEFIQGAIGFWAADSRLDTGIQNNSNLAVWVTDRKDEFLNSGNMKFGKHDNCGFEKKHEIKGYVNTQNSGQSKGDYASISNLMHNYEKTFNTPHANKVVIYLSESVSVIDLNIEGITNKPLNDFSGSNGKMIFKSDFEKKSDISISGQMQITGQSGYVLVAVGKGK